MSSIEKSSPRGQPITRVPRAWRLDSREAQSTVVIMTSLAFVMVVLRFAWVCDDAFVSFRAAYNLTHGYGLLSNPGERVQGFSNPLWTLLVALTMLLVNDPYHAAILLSIACVLSLAVVVGHGGRWPAAWAVVVLACSYSFVSFSTSGLENPLAHVLLAAFALRIHAIGKGDLRWPWLPWILAGLVAWNRLDHVLLVLPALLWLVRRQGGRAALRRAVLGFVPLLSWLGFALVYYGFPFPNTAYAKLNFALPRRDVLLQGLCYLADSLTTDPLPLLSVSVLFAYALWRWRNHGRRADSLALAAGALTYVLYVVWIGGDFMSGRFLAAPFVLSVMGLSGVLTGVPVMASALMALALIPGVRMMSPQPAQVPFSCPIPPSGIVDERLCYAETTGLVQNLRTRRYKEHDFYVEGRRLRKAKSRVSASPCIGLTGYAMGPRRHLIDTNALTDPLLARIRFPAQKDWRPGHLTRTVPPGYPSSIQQDKNLLEDPCLRGLYDDLRAVTRGPLFSPQRWQAIWRCNARVGSCAGCPAATN